MRSAAGPLLASVRAAAGLTVLAASAGPAAAWHNHRWYADRIRPCCGAVYGPPVVHVVSPTYAYYPRPLYSVGCCNILFGLAGTYHTAYYSRYG